MKRDNRLRSLGGRLASDARGLFGPCTDSNPDSQLELFSRMLTTLYLDQIQNQMSGRTTSLFIMREAQIKMHLRYETASRLCISTVQRRGWRSEHDR